jgi:Family of unknown function (DUF6252)
MQKIIIIAFIYIMFSGISCKKNDSQNTIPPFQSYIRFKLDNVQTECTSLIKATYFPQFPDTAITISGAFAAGAIALYIHNAQLLAPGIYTFNSAKGYSGTIWTNGPGAIRYVAGADLFLNLYGGSGQITITEISTVYVKGTFDFVTAVDIPTNTFKTVTNGTFNIKRG